VVETWGKLFGLAPVAVKNFPKAVPELSTCPSLVYGVELEIENVPNWPDMLVPGIRAETDGSLRNNGKEFITAPMTYSNLSHCLNMFFKKNKLSDENYSERTSIHVHTNCIDLTVDQITTIAFVYQVVEGLLFNWVDHTRADNIFCVPWSQTNLTYNSFNRLGDTSRWKRWQKYTALNLLPLYEQGTIEWRHMNGHCDVNKLLTWCQLIGSIYTYALNTSLDDVEKELMSLNTTSLYSNILSSVFKERADLFFAMPNYQRILEEGVLNMKYSLQTKEVKSVLKTAKENPFARMIYDDAMRQEYVQAAEQLRNMARQPIPAEPEIRGNNFARWMNIAEANVAHPGPHVIVDDIPIPPAPEREF